MSHRPPITPEEWAAGARRMAAYEIAVNLDVHGVEVRTYSALADFCERRRVLPAHNLAADLFGFGTVEVAFTNTDHPGWWCLLADLVEPLAVPIEALHAAVLNDMTEGGEHSDRVVIRQEGHRDREAHVVDAVFVLRAMVEMSPWSGVLLHNLTAGQYTAGPGGALRPLGGSR